MAHRRRVWYAGASDVGVQQIRETGGGEAIRLYGWPARLAVGTLVAVSKLSLPVILIVMALWTEPPIAHARTFFQARLFLVFALVPFLLSRALRWLCAGRAFAEGDTLVMAGRGLRIEIPRASIGRLVPWAVPLPGPGFWLVLRSGQRFRYGFEPERLTATLAGAGFEAAQVPAAHPAIAYAAAKQNAAWRWYHLLVKFGLFPLVPGLLIFRLDQFLRFGGTLGQYYLEGLAPYVENMTLHVAAGLMNCILWASLWRTLGEPCAFAGAWLAPHRAATVRRIVEAACSLAYYGGIGSMIAYAFLR